MQAPGLRLPLGRDLRRLPLHLRLRAARRAPAAQRQGRLVALDGAAARRRRRPRRRHPLAPGHLGGVGPPPELHRPAGRLPELQGALPPRPARGPRAVPELRRPRHLHRGPPVQPHVQDPRRAGGGRRRPRPTSVPRRRRACSSTSRTCSRRRGRSRRSASPRSASRSATRSRPATSSSAPGSSSRWSWSSSCRRPRLGHVVRVLVRRALPLVRATSASPRTTSGSGPTTPRS